MGVGAQGILIPTYTEINQGRFSQLRDIHRLVINTWQFAARALLRPNFVKVLVVEKSILHDHMNAL